MEKVDQEPSVDQGPSSGGSPTANAFSMSGNATFVRPPSDRLVAGPAAPGQERPRASNAPALLPLVLFGEQEPCLRSCLEATLKQCGFRVISAGDAHQVLDQRRHPAARATTIIMPQPDEPSGPDESKDVAAETPDAGSAAWVIALLGAALHGETNTDRTVAERVLRFGPIEMDLIAHRVHCEFIPISLSPTEFRILHHLMTDPLRAFSRAELQKAVWPCAVHVGSRTLDVHVGHLRKALRKVGQGHLVRTIRSIGYALAG